MTADISILSWISNESEKMMDGQILSILLLHHHIFSFTIITYTCYIRRLVKCPHSDDPHKIPWINWSLIFYTFRVKVDDIKSIREGGEKEKWQEQIDVVTKWGCRIEGGRQVLMKSNLSELTLSRCIYTHWSFSSRQNPAGSYSSFLSKKRDRETISSVKLYFFFGSWLEYPPIYRRR